MVIRNVAWDANGTTPSKTGGAFNTTYYNTNVPSMSNRSAGKLFLGSYSYSGNSESYNEGTSFSSRPSTMKGWYKYTPDNNDVSELTLRQHQTIPNLQFHWFTPLPTKKPIC